MDVYKNSSKEEVYLTPDKPGVGIKRLNTAESSERSMSCTMLQIIYPGSELVQIFLHTTAAPNELFLRFFPIAYPFMYHTPSK